MDQLEGMEKDILIEIATIGSGNASMALSKMLSKKFEVKVPMLKLIPIEKISEMMGDSEQVITVVLIKIIGDVPGTMMLLFNPENAIKLTEQLTGRTKRDGILDEADRSALKEVGNILSGSALNALADFLDFTLVQSIPDIATDMLSAVINTTIADLGETADKVLLLETVFRDEENTVEGKYYLLFDPKSTRVILDAVKKKIAK
ncbi:MAG: chemotaxis protein CheC [Candidatus Levybacteria bacterium]|nr:chemotaxis protein CheC [Candidatus Levybacteria bacterium]